MTRRLYRYFSLIILIIVCSSLDTFAADWKARWITANDSQRESNSWLVFNKTVTLEGSDRKAVAHIAADSKYWLWINDHLVVFEGGLKRGPAPEDTYYDEVLVGPYLKAGENSITVLLWYFGKDGFSHKSSGTPGLLFDCQSSGGDILSDDSWKSTVLRNFQNTSAPYPNYRLSESNIRFDARRGKMEFARGYFGSNPNSWKLSREICEPGDSPWNRLVKRPIPLLKDYGLKSYESVVKKEGSISDTLYASLPHNAQVTPYLKINADAGLTIDIRTDNYMGGGTANVRGEYVTASGTQDYENPGWMNGHNVIYVIPKGIEVIDLKYRESGYNCEFTGSFTCDDPFFNLLWKKAARTLYITMRDNYMDCPDRERAQWWGDMVNESGEAFYALSPPAADLTKKGMLELINWQRPDSVIYAPVPAGNWDRELPGQMLASIGKYGFWNYYLNTGDKQTISEVYEGVKKYLDIWKLQDNGILVERQGDWYWGDWGVKIDKQLLFNSWYYLALEGFANMSDLLGKTDEAQLTRASMLELKKSYNRVFWDGKGYRTKDYDGDYDDRAQALAVVAGLVPEENYSEVLQVLKTSFLASPYMEKYVLEALCLMGQEEYALERMKNRFGEMVNDQTISTLWEGWGIGRDGFGGGTINHAWSGGGLTILSQYICGIEPLEPGFKSFSVRPRLAGLKNINVKVPTVYGEIVMQVSTTKGVMDIDLDIPENTMAHLILSDEFAVVESNGTVLKESSGKIYDSATGKTLKKSEKSYSINPGRYSIQARDK